MPSLAAWPVDAGRLETAAGRPWTLPRRLRRDRLLGRWIAAWLGATALGVANAGVRELVYADRVGKLAAHQISTATLLAALTSLRLARGPAVAGPDDPDRAGHRWHLGGAHGPVRVRPRPLRLAAPHGRTFWPTTTWPTAASGCWCRCGWSSRRLRCTGSRPAGASRMARFAAAYDLAARRPGSDGAAPERPWPDHPGGHGGTVLPGLADRTDIQIALTALRLP